MFLFFLVPTGSPQGLTATLLSPQSIQLDWMPPSLSDQNGILTNYTILVMPLDTGISQIPITSVANTLIVQNLLPYTVYVCIVAANNAVGRGPFSSVLTVLTPETGKYLAAISPVSRVHGKYSISSQGGMMLAIASQGGN